MPKPTNSEADKCLLSMEAGNQTSGRGDDELFPLITQAWGPLAVPTSTGAVTVLVGRGRRAGLPDGVHSLPGSLYLSSHHTPTSK